MNYLRISLCVNLMKVPCIRTSRRRHHIFFVEQRLYVYQSMGFDQMTVKKFGEFFGLLTKLSNISVAVTISFFTIISIDKQMRMLKGKTSNKCDCETCQCLYFVHRDYSSHFLQKPCTYIQLSTHTQQENIHLYIYAHTYKYSRRIHTCIYTHTYRQIYIHTHPHIRSLRMKRPIFLCTSLLS